MIEHKTADDIKTIIDTHYYGQETAAPAAPAATVAEDDIPYEDAPKPVVKAAAPKAEPVKPAAKPVAKADPKSAQSSNDDAVMAILDGLNDL